jgi:serine phosphatase RsbU (regulator of sigma subunit)
MRFILFLVSFSMFLNPLLAQKSAKDSLEILLKKEKKSENEKAKKLLAMSKDVKRVSNERALLYAQQALLIAEKNNFKNKIGEALIQIANAYYALEDYQKALEYFIRSANFYKIQQDLKGEANALRLIGETYHNLGNYQQALFQYAESMKIYEKIKSKDEVAKTLISIGKTYFQSQNFLTAKENFDQALQLVNETENNELKAICQSNLGMWCASQKLYNKALEYYQKSEAIWKNNPNNQKELAQTLVGKAEVYHVIGKSSNEVLVLFLEAKKLYENDRYNEGIATSFLGIGDVYMRTKTYTQAIEYFSKSLNIGKNLRSKKIIRDSYQKLSEAYEALGNYNLAFQNHKSFKIYHDSLYRESEIFALSDIQTRLRYDVKERETKIQKEIIASKNEKIDIEKKRKEELERNNRLQFFLIIISFLLLILGAVFLYVLYKSRKDIRHRNEQLKQRNLEIQEQKAQLEQKTHLLEQKSNQLERTYIKITDSIRYAETIQQSILPPDNKIQQILPNYFIISKPKDVVSGDFYWVAKVENYTFVAVVDCTGHGVSGGLMTMIGHTLLNEIVNQQHIYSPAQILSLLNEGLDNIIERQTENIAIGMEIAFCRFEKSHQNHVKLTYAGAKRPLWILEPDENQKLQFIELAGGSEPIGFGGHREKIYQNQEISLKTGSSIYLASDGYADQANPNKKRIGSTQLKQLLQDSANLPLAEQKIFLEKTLAEHQKTATQRDDITLMGIKI